MKITALVLTTAILLSGCSNPFASYKEIEHFLVIQSMGIDKINGGVTVSLAASSSAGSDKPRCLQSSGTSIASAMEHVYSRSYEDEVFCHNVRNIVIGEAAAEDGIYDYLSFICRSPITRLDVPIFIVKENEASAVFSESGDAELGIADIMQNLQHKLESRGGGTFSSADVMRNILRGGSSLVCALKLEKAAENEDEKQSLNAIPDGYAVIRDGKLCKYIDTEGAMAADILLSRGAVHEIEVNDGHGGRVTLEVTDGKADFTPLWSEEALTGMQIHISAQYSVTDTSGAVFTDKAEYEDTLTAALESELLNRTGELIKTSSELKADFLNLASHAEKSRAESFRRIKQPFADLLPGLEFQLSVSCRLSHTNDMDEL